MNRGFTLIEMLIAVVILGIIAPVLYGVLHAGISSYEKGTAEQAAQENVYGFFQLFHGDTESMLSGEKNTAFTQTAITLTVPSAEDAQMQKITYSLGDKVVTRRVQEMKPSDGADSPQKGGEAEPEGSAVLFDVESFSMTYMYNGKWKDNKAGADADETDRDGGALKNALPQAVKISVKLNTNGKTYEETFRLAYAEQSDGQQGAEQTQNSDAPEQTDEK